MFGLKLPIAGHLLASNPLFESLSKAVTDQQSGDDALLFWMGVGGFVLTVFIIARAAHRRSAPKPRPKVDYLTAAIDLLGLTESERRELQRIARRAKLDEPASMLMTPRNLSKAAGETLSGQAATDARQRVAGLAQRLFGEALPMTPAAVGTAVEEEEPVRTSVDRPPARPRKPRADGATRN